MPRDRRPTSAPAPRLPAHDGLLGGELADWAGAEIARLGRKDALLGRVEALEISEEGRAVSARVRGERPTPYHARVMLDGDEATLHPDCDCPAAPGAACRHVVAALEALRFPLRNLKNDRRRHTGRGARGSGRVVRQARAQDAFVVLGESQRNLTRSERVAVARDEEIRLRVNRARRQKAAVEQVNRRDEPPRFRVADRNDGAHTVVLRGERGKLARCSCADFAQNELGTCRHVERVRMWYLRKPKHMPSPLISFWWSPRAWGDRAPLLVREFRVDGIDCDLTPLGEWFDEEGWLREPPDDRNPAAWAATAWQQAERLASRSGASFEVDSLVEARLAALQRSRRTPCEESSWEAVLSDFGFKLHPYQRVGAAFLAECGRSFLADDMGLGKTVQAIAAAEAMRHEGEIERVLIVCPASLKHQWRAEIERACGERATVVDGRRALRLEAYRDWRGGYLIANYELVLRDLEEFQRAGADLVVLDEAQRIKNWNTKTARAVKRLHSRHAFVLTGTPLENRLLELHSLVEYIHPRALGPRWRLLPYHAVTAEEGRVIAYEQLGVLRGRLREFFLRRERAQVLDQLPERTDNTFRTDMTPAQLRPYRRHAAQLAKLISGRQPLRPNEVRLMLQLLTRMRVLCNAAAQHDWDGIAPRLRRAEPPTPSEIKAIASPKLEEFARVVEDVLDGTATKIVVFSQWERTLRLAEFFVREQLSDRGLRAEIFHGGLSSSQRGAMIDAFNEDETFRVMFSTDAGGLGLNLQQAASVVVNLEVPWNPAILRQRIGRVHRMGQRRTVQVLHFVTRDAIEERVLAAVENKQALFAGLLSDELDTVSFDDPTRRSSLVERVRDLVDDGAEAQRGSSIAPG